MSADSTSRTFRPMHRIPLPDNGPPRLTALATGTPVWLVTRYADVRQGLMDPRFNRKSLRDADAPPPLVLPDPPDSPDGLPTQDGPSHQLLRGTVQRAFTPRAVARWRPWTASVVETLLDDLAEQRQPAANRPAEHPPPADIVEGFPRRLPVSVISRLMGLEHADWERIRDWADHALSGGA